VPRCLLEYPELLTLLTFAVRELFGIAGLLQVATAVEQMILSRIYNVPPSIVMQYNPSGGLSLQDMCPPVLSDRIF